MAKHLIQVLSDSKIYRDYERAFCVATGLNCALRPVESWQLPHHGKPFENPFCALVAQAGPGCGACLLVQQQLSEAATREPKTVTCQAGLCDTAVPVRMGDQLIGFLTTGQVFRKKPTEAQFKRTARLLAEWGVPTAVSELRKTYFNTRVLSSGESQAAIKLLTIFAQHLSLVSNQVFLQDRDHELPAIRLAKQFIQEHQAEKITLNQVAKAVNMSRFNFCKTFSKAVGIHFTDYLVRLRIERAKNLLLNPNLRVSEIAFEAGFQSLTHFNRVFKRILGRSPTDFRERLARA